MVCFCDLGMLYIDEKLAEIQRREESRDTHNDDKAAERTDLLTFMLANRDLSREEVYANVTEILLSGIDTVSVLTSLRTCYAALIR